MTDDMWSLRLSVLGVLLLDQRLDLCAEIEMNAKKLACDLVEFGLRRHALGEIVEHGGALLAGARRRLAGHRAY